MSKKRQKRRKRPERLSGKVQAFIDFNAWVRDERARSLRPITLPRVLPEEKALSSKEREIAIEKAMAILDGSHRSKFEFEGACRHGMRSALCLTGHRWIVADVAAADVVREALRRLGAARPTWDEGQREYVIPRENCARCGGEIPDELLVGERRYKFCSDECARWAVFERDYERQRADNEMYRCAQDVLLRFKAEVVNCKHCNRPFRPTLGRKGSVFCSQQCAAASRKGEERACANCGTMFYRSPAFNAVYCSTKCSNEARRKVIVEKRCECCGATFVARSKKARYCSTACTMVVSRLRTGRAKRVTARVFDYVFRPDILRRSGAAQCRH